MRALRKQAEVGLRFHRNPDMTVDERIRQIDEALAPIKLSPDTVKYSLDELKEIYLTTNRKRLKTLYNHEANHAEQMKKVLLEMGIGIKPEFDVYYCPCLANFDSPGGAIGLLEMRRDTLHLTRNQILDFDKRVALKMLKSSHNSLGDVYIILGIFGGKVISEIRKVTSKPKK
jgi:hypothetical protein